MNTYLRAGTAIVREHIQRIQCVPLDAYDPGNELFGDNARFQVRLHLMGGGYADLKFRFYFYDDEAALFWLAVWLDEGWLLERYLEQRQARTTIRGKG